MPRIEAATTIAKNTGRSILTWEWTKKLLHWIIISAGTMSECVFLIASLWVSINANVHQFVLLFVDEQMTKHITELATTAYVALPECIVGLAVVVTLSHIRMVMYNRKEYRAWIWSVLYGLPTIVFLLLSLITLGNAVASVTFEMPTGLVVIRALAGYLFAFTSLLYTQIGIPQEKDRLAQKDALLADWQTRMAQEIADLIDEKDAQITALTTQLATETRRLHAIIDNQNQELQTQKQTNTNLITIVNKSSENALHAYSAECKEWLNSGVKTVFLDEITRYTGHSKRKISNAITGGHLQTAPRNKELILVSSLVEWLKQNQPLLSKSDQESGPTLRIVNG